MNWIQNTNICGAYKWIVVFVVSVLLFNLSTISGQSYTVAYEKAYTDTLELSSYLYAYGYFSAAYINYLSNSYRTHCWGSYSCYQIGHLVSRSVTDAAINCFGLSSCARSGVTSTIGL